MAAGNGALDAPVTKALALLMLLVVALALGGCSTYRPWQNAPSATPSPAATPSGQRSIVAAITLSGGGTRAAAFGLGVLRELKATAFEWEGRPTTLLDEVSFVSGVSGGSVLAAHYAAFGDEVFEWFEPEFLHVDVQRRLLRLALGPQTMWRLSSPWFGRTHVLAEELDRLYRGRTLGDVAARRGAPELLVTATDLRTGFAFEFAPDMLGRLCTDWREVPLAFAVAASAAVPIVLTPLTLRNHAGACPAQAAPPPAADFRTQLLNATAASFGDARARPFVHLVDGGLADNLGVRGLLDRFAAGGSMREVFRDATPGSIRRLLLVVVNAERDTSEAIELNGEVPSIGQVADSLLFGAGARDTQVTLAILDEDAARWALEVQEQRGRPGSPFAPDAELHVVTVSLRDVADPKLRNGLLQLPTAFTLPHEDVNRLQAAGADALRHSSAYRALKRSLSAP